jgi:hypothetical protein
MKAYPCEPLQREHPTEEWNRMMDYSATQARAKGVLLPPHSRWGLAEAAVAKAMVSSPPPTTDEADRLYHQLTKIHAIDPV